MKSPVSLAAMCTVFAGHGSLMEQCSWFADLAAVNIIFCSGTVGEQFIACKQMESPVPLAAMCTVFAGHGTMQLVYQSSRPSILAFVPELGLVNNSLCAHRWSHLFLWLQCVRFSLAMEQCSWPADLAANS
jgi:hypothetical protein